ncbi:MAG: Unknown protein [uncultured Sulfurovum sp.]|uniref:Response regulatory domain-containing protein n=1 Tax=uncultured Sulfurovum sp. TaxID=269237 RepID=A0A6S6STQ6_9BACT|nr:MAG: Unknown protein [uncultured Sulfurovum sp.]
MHINKKWNILFIKEENSKFTLDTETLDRLFNQVDVAQGKGSVLKYFNANVYDIIISDLSIEPRGAGFLKQLKDQKPDQTIFAMVSPKDTDKLYGIADLGINAFELTPAQFTQALETIAEFNPYAGQ